MANRPFKASDIDDTSILRVVDLLQKERGMWTNTTEVSIVFRHFPFKVVAAKLSKLLKRGLVTGCDCGCRGDWELTAKGRTALADEGISYGRLYKSDASVPS